MTTDLHPGTCACCGDGILPGDTTRADDGDQPLGSDCGRETG